ncbi:MAG: hypothetical protein H6826_00010 [Planctomycetes bacterium]|nr:hypothetical protein [Planctomycetota bacterium]
MKFKSALMARARISIAANPESQPKTALDHISVRAPAAREHVRVAMTAEVAAVLAPEQSVRLMAISKCHWRSAVELTLSMLALPLPSVGASRDEAQDQRVSIAIQVASALLEFGHRESARKVLVRLVIAMGADHPFMEEALILAARVSRGTVRLGYLRRVEVREGKLAHYARCVQRRDASPTRDEWDGWKHGSLPLAKGYPLVKGPRQVPCARRADWAQDSCAEFWDSLILTFDGCLDGRWNGVYALPLREGWPDKLSPWPPPDVPPGIRMP